MIRAKFGAANVWEKHILFEITQLNDRLNVLVKP